MHWLNIVWIVLLLVLLFRIAPYVKQAVENTPKGSSSDWMGFVIPIVGIALFIVLLVWLV